MMDRSTIRFIALAVIMLGMLPRAIARIREAGLVRAMLLRVAAGAALLAATFWVAFGIDAGRYAGQPHAERLLLVTLMMIGMLTGVILIISVLWAEHGVFGVPFQFIAWVAFAVVGIAALMVAGEQLEQRFGIYHERLVYGCLAGALALATLLRPWWFWEHRKARFVRDIIGDQGTIVLYLLIAGGFGWWGILGPWGPGHALRRTSFAGRIAACYHLRGAGVDDAGLGSEIAYAPGFETGFALWLPRAERGDTIRHLAYDGRWYRTAGDTTLIRIDQDATGSTAEVVVAPGPFPREGSVVLPSGAAWGNVTTGRVVPVRVDSTSCAVEIAHHG